MHGLKEANVLTYVEGGHMMVEDENGQLYEIAEQGMPQALYEAPELAAVGESGFVRRDGTQIHVRPIGTRNIGFTAR